MPSSDIDANSFLRDELLAEAIRRVSAAILTSDAVSAHAKELALETLNRVRVALELQDAQAPAARRQPDIRSGSK